MKRNTLSKALWGVLLVGLLVSPALFPQEFQKVSRVIDGDTFVLENGERVRLIGVDTPETVHPSKPVGYFGKEASAFTKNIIEGKRVRLEYDVQKQDRYGRLLAYVYLPDGTFVNAELVKQGYAQVSTYPPNVKYVDLFTRLQREAREQNRGLWAQTEAVQSDTTKDHAQETVYITKSGTKYHSDGCRYLSKSKIPISLKEAAASYGPCGVCNPPVTQQSTSTSQASAEEKKSITVYVTKSGSKYHRAGCRYLKSSSIPMSLENAKGRYSPCSVCNPPR